MTLPGEHFAGQVLGRNFQTAADTDLAQRLLRQAKINVNGIQRLELNYRIARGQVLPEIDLANSQRARERRADRFALNGGADFADIRLGLFLLGGGLVVLQPRDHALFHQLLACGRN